ncbi:non-heme iron oxygenase ferredoxin subunit [Bradyrhizobium sp. STM 3562]|uniref:non-heme iron oxygenase ferredoxin subunit n=1 Tax=Bradyrhizobium sp. STM 3562 TaxID=578924 RepID=UPI00388D2AEB
MTSSWKHLCAAAKLAEGEPVGFQLDDQRVAVYKIGDEIFATDDVCSHAFALLSTGFLDEHVIECPLHGGMFDVRTGKCRSGGYKDIRTFPVEVRQGEIFVNLASAEDEASAA